MSKRDCKVTAVVLCAGSGTRTGLAYNKILHYIGAKTVLETTLDAICPLADNTVCVCAECDSEKIGELISVYENVTLCRGGATRSDSVRHALEAVLDTDIIVIHDGARPFVTEKIIADTIASAIDYGSGIAAIPATDAVKCAENGIVTRSLDKQFLYNAQTPQTFRYNEIADAYKKIGGSYGDDCELYALAGYTPRITPGSAANIKITTPEDLLKIPRSGLKIGAGFDVHKLVAGRRLILGGVKINFEKGLLGHSDADVLTHPIMDAVLSAAELPDIGVLFPDTDDEYKGADSVLLLKEVAKLALQGGYNVSNVSAVIMAQQPKLAPHIPLMRQKLADALGIDNAQINISATTTETLGIVGNGGGMAASCTCLLSKL